MPHDNTVSDAEASVPVDFYTRLPYITHVGHQYRVNYQELKAKLITLRLLALAALIVLPSNVSAEGQGNLVQCLDTGRIDWSTATVRARGIAVPPAVDGGHPPEPPSDMIEAARRAAQSDLLRTVEAIRINDVFRVADQAAGDAAFREGLITLVRNASITHQDYLSNGTVEIELTMSLTGGFAQFVLPEEIRQVDSVVAMSSDEPEVKRPESEGADGPHTGLILDATGIDAMPSLVPAVVDESGQVVYGPAFVSREFAVSRGMCGFATTLADARSDSRVGARPLIVKAIRTRSTERTELVVASTDAARVRSSVVHLNFLKACRVNIVMDPQVCSPAASPF